MKQFTLLLPMLIFFCLPSFAQESCEVKLKEIQGTYTGDCVKGKAEGRGKSAGTDEYEGEFKKGYPDGKGMYIWKDGHYFIGTYIKGKKEGSGKMYYENSVGDDSVITGYWKNDKYIGEYEKQFMVMSNTSHITKIDCKYIDRKGENISIQVHQLYGGRSLASPALSISYITDITVLAGIFQTKNTQSLSNSSITQVQQVNFPFRAIFYFSNGENADILFNEKGNYDVYIDMQ